MVGTPNNGVNGSPENGVYGTPNYGIGGTPNSVGTRLVYSAQEPSPGSAAVSIVDSDYGSIEFSKEDVEVLLNEKARVKSRYNFKERCEAMSDYIRRLRQCIRWFQQLEGCYEIDQDHLRAMLESSEQKCGEIEMLLRNKEEELNAVIMELRKNYTTMEEKLAKADSEKMATMDSLCKEREARQESEKFRESLSEELARAQRDLQSASQQISVLTDTHKRAQEYNVNLQQYNCKLQEDLDIANDNLKQAEKEKATVAENLSEQRVQNTVLLEQLTSIKASHDDVMNQKDELVNEVACLKKELQQMKDDCDQKQFQVEELMAEAAEYKESRDEVIKQKDDLVNEVACLRKELQQIKDDRDGKLLQVEKLMAEAAKFKDFHDEVMKQKDELVNEVACLRKELQQIKDDCDRKQLQVEELMAEAAEYKDSRGEVIKQKEELVNEVASLSKELQKMRDDRDSKLLQVEELMAEAVEHKESYDEVIKQKDELVNEVASHKKELQKISDDRDCKLLQVEELMAEVATHKNSNAKLVAELDSLTVKSNELEARCGSQIDQIKTLEDQLTAAEQMLEMSDLSAIEIQSVSEGHKKLIRELQTSLANAEFKLIEGEKLRKKLHNTILELKGNIRVFCRVRPLLPEDNSSTEGKIISFPSSLEAVGRGIDLVHNGQKHSFSFDQVFMPDASQEDVFVEISQLVQSALDGYKVCIFAYGQTGSGKTHTMMGRPGHLGQKGLIPRSLEQIFKTIQSLESQGWKYEMQVSMLEIYNETIRDLLSTNRSSLDTLKMENGSAGKQYVIKHDAHGNTYVSDLTVVDVRSTKEVSYLLNQAVHSRSVGKTQMNEYSSRSHFVFTLKMSGVNESTDQQVQGVLNLIDLAGSERLSKSGSTGDRLKETQAINKSLSSLGDVIFSLAKRDDHIPFRNSKLTYLLQPCLGGDSKTLMFVNISPDSTSANESLCSLRFASRVNACEIGTPRRQTNMRSPESRLSYG